MESKVYDGHLCVVADQSLMFENNVNSAKFYYSTSGSERFELINPYYFTAIWLSKQLSIDDLLSGLLKPAEVLNGSRGPEMWLAETFELASEIASVLMEGRVKVSILINTSGGYATEVKIIRNVVDHLVNNGGSVHSFGLDKVASVGAKAFVIPPNAKQRFLTADTDFMFHRSTRYDKTSGKLVLSSSKEEMRRYLMSITEPKMRGAMSRRINKAFEKPMDPTNPLWLNGSQVQQYGIGTMVENRAKLKECFEGYHNSCSELCSGTAIEEFFAFETDKN